MKTNSRVLACGIEPLETRIAPASLTFADVDGDKIVITTSGTGALVLNGNVFVVGDGVGIDLTVGAAGFQGANVSVVATRVAGDGFVNVRYLNAGGIDLGAVLIDGALDEITCGDATTDIGFGLKSLSVQSLGRPGTIGVENHIIGGLGRLKIKGDLNDAWLHVTGNGAGDEAHGTIGSVTIGGSILGGPNLHSGSIESSGDIGAVKIGQNILGGAGSASGTIQSDSGRIKSVTLGGSLIGAPGQFSGQIRSGSDLGPVKIGGDVKGGSGPTSGFIASFTGSGPDNGNIASITIGGFLIGGANFESGHIHSKGTLGSVKIGHDVQGGTGNQSGFITSDGAMGRVRIGGSLLGGSGQDSGVIFASGMGAVSITGSILGTNTDPIGIQNRSGVVESLGTMGAVKVGGDVNGGIHSGSGFIHSTGRLAALTITGSLLGGVRGESGGILADAGVSGLTKIGGDVTGGLSAETGVVAIGVVGGAATGKTGAVRIGGTITGNGSHTGGRVIFGSDQLTPSSLTIKGDAIGVAITGHDLGTLSISGSVTSSFVGFTGAVGAISIGKDLGSAATTTRIFVLGHDATPGHPSLTIKRITIGGDVINASINAGSDGSVAQNPDAQIGAVKVGGNWTDSDLTAGVTDGGDAFGDANDVAMSQTGEPDGFFSRIASIVIRGNVSSAPPPFTHGFVAQQIGSFKSLGFTAPLTTGTDRDTAIPGTTTIRIVEVI